MYKVIKNGSLILAANLALLLFSCNNDTKDKPKEETPPKDTTVAVNVPPTPPAFTPFDMAEMTHTVKDYAKWRPYYNSDSLDRKGSGMGDMVVGRSMDNPNKIFLAWSVADTQKLKDFAANPKLKAVMDKAGVNSKPELKMWHVFRIDPTVNEKKWVLVTHQVKDFAAWLKAYDAEGVEKRKSEGMLDFAIFQGINDPNLVQIVFDITDLAKARAAINSAEKKALMTSAGVIGIPKIEYYTTAE